MNNKGDGELIIPFRYLAFALVIQGLIAMLPTVLTPGDPKYSRFLGFSIFRWMEIVSFLVVIVFCICVSLNVKNIVPRIIKGLRKFSTTRINFWFGFFLIVLFWFTIWFPATRLPKLQDEIIRIKPLLLFLELLLVEIYCFFNWNTIKKWISGIRKIFLHNKNWLLPIPFLSIIIVFIILRIYFSKSIGIISFLTPGPSIFPLQLLISLTIFIVLFYVEIKNVNSRNSNKRIWDFLAFFLIWGSVFLLWFITPFKCYGDRPGPFPPNNICYPQVDDSVLSIGAHYITLGRGVLNHWFTDKPLYMFFLALGQWIFGQRIDQYIVFQIIVISSIPGLLFLAVRNWISRSGSFLLAMLSAILGMNSILLYSELDGANVFIENTEVLTGFLLILLTISLIKHFTIKSGYYYIFISGCLLGLATLSRINPILVLPMILVLVFAQNRLNFRKGISTTLVLLLGFFLVFSPWLVTAKDSSGKNFYLTKIEGVLTYRYPSISSPNDQNIIATEVPGNTSTDTTVNPLPATSDPVETGAINNGSKIANVIYYFLNNEFQSLAKLPVNLTLASMPVIYHQPVWTKSADIPLWSVDFSVENVVTVCINLLIIALGISVVLRSHGVAGIVPLFIQIGYYFGNGIAQTSGDRYLQPVEWVFLLYFVIGIYSIVNYLFSGSTDTNEEVIAIEDSAQSTKRSISNPLLIKIGSIIIVLMIGVSLILISFIKDKVSTLNDVELKTFTQQQISDYSKNSDYGLDVFMNNPKAIIIEGIAYHSRYYSSPIAFDQRKVFETTILGKNNVYISNWIYEPELMDLPDGSRVILVGCKIKEVNYWGVQSVIVKTLALIPFDDAKKSLIAKENDFVCEYPQ